jgi:Protein of unknown function (DUF3445)/Periplasmic binding protein
VGKHSVEAAQMAVDDFGGKVLGKPVVVVTADHQNKPDIATALSRKWFDIEGVDAITDIAGSAVALAERAMVLRQDPSRCIVLPHMMAAQWDTLELIMESLAQDYPEDFELLRNGDRWTWINKPLGIQDVFVFGDSHSLPYEPLEYIARQAQGDFTLQDQRDNDLFVDGGMVTTQADWSLEFNVGMTFHERRAAFILTSNIRVARDASASRNVPPGKVRFAAGR